MYSSQCFEPGKALSAFVSGIYIIRSPQEIVVNSLPQPDVSLTFRCKGAIYADNGKDCPELPDAVVTMSYNAGRRYRLAADTTLIIVHFKACAFQAFFSLPVKEARHDLTALLQDTEPGFLPLLQYDISDRERIAHTEALLCRRFNAKKADAIMMSAADRIQSAKGSLRISRLYEAMYLSESQFEKRFRRSAGCSAKKYASLIRIHKVITGETEGDDITDTAYEAGYFDQAHFIRDFKAYTGYTPKRFFKLQQSWGQVVPALGFVAP